MRVSFPVQINSLGTVKAISFGLNYDPAAIANPSVILGNAINGNLAVTQGGNFVGIQITNATIPQGNGILLTIVFDVIGGSGTTNLTWTNSSVYQTSIIDVAGNSLSWGANTGIIHLDTGTAESIGINILGESPTRQLPPNPLPEPVTPTPVVAPAPVTEPVPITPNPVNTTVPPQPIITGDPTGGGGAIITPAPVPTPTTTTNPLSSFLAGFSLSSIIGEITPLKILGGGAAIYFLTRKKKRTRR